MKTAVLLVIACFVVAASIAQPPSELYQMWSEANPSIKASLFFNQDKYAPGDSVYFKVFLFENQQLLTGSSIMTLSVINDRGKQCAKVNFRINGGQTHNRIFLPDSLQPGYYNFIAFTDWMIDNPSSPFFSKEIPIVSGEALRQKQNAEPTVHFFPEGGHFVSGVTNKIVVQSSDETETGIASVFDDSTRQVATTNLKGGLGVLFMTPERGLRYTLKINGRNVALPQHQNDGVVILTTTPKNRGPIRAVISAPASSSFRGDSLLLMLTANGQVYFTQHVLLGDQLFVHYTIPTAALPAGVARLAIFGREQQPLAERSFYVDHAKAVVAEVKAQEIARVRDKVTVEVALSGSDGPVQGEFAVSAINAKLFPPASHNQLADEVLLPSNIARRIDRSSADWEDRLDQLLISMATDEREWKEMFAARPVDRSGGAHFHLSFNTFYKENGKPAPDSTLMAVFLQRDATGYECIVKDGKFDLYPLGDFKGIDELYCIPTYKGVFLEGIAVSNIERSIESKPSTLAVKQNEIDPYADFANKARTIQRSYSFFTTSEQSAPIVNDPNQELEDELDGADITVELNKYISFPNMDEVIREVVPALYHHKKGGKSDVFVDVTNTLTPPHGDPLFVIDGIMTRDVDYFMSLDPINVLTIKIVRDAEKLRNFGPVGMNGVVFVRTREPKPEEVRARGTFVPVQGISWPVTTPVKPTAIPPDLPDFRSTLLWNPSVKTDKAGKATFSFYASDDVGPVSIRIVGLTTQGVPFAAEAVVNVVFDQESSLKH